jgi:CheY-like chemotaxis protein
MGLLMLENSSQGSGTTVMPDNYPFNGESVYESRLAPYPILGVEVNILIVEDNVAIRRLIRRTVSHLVADIHECEDGADALKAYSEYRPDLVFMDVRMPRMDGLTATKEILNVHPEARIVIVTDYDEDDLRAAAFAIGAKGYVLKDNLADLEALLRSEHLIQQCGSEEK